MPIVNVEGVGQVNFPDSMSNEQINSAIERDILPKYPEIQAKQSRTYGESISDIGMGLGKGIGSLLQIPGQVAGLITGDVNPDTGLQGLGRRMEETYQENKSPILQAKENLRQQKISKAEGFFDEAGTAIGATLRDPALLTSFFTEQIPNLVGTMGGGFATKAGINLLMRNATETALAKAGVRGAIGTGSVMQGADIGTDTYEKVHEELIRQGVEPHKAAQEALARARIAAIEATALSIGTSFGAGSTIERALTRGAAGAPKKGVIRGTLGETLSEGIEEGGGQLASNVQLNAVNPDIGIMKGVGSAAGLGAVGGALFGLPSSIINTADANQIERAKAQMEEAKRRAKEENKPQEITLQLGYDPNVQGNGIYTPIIVNPDGTTIFPSERNKYAQVVPNELSEEGMSEKYGIRTPEQIQAQTFSPETIKGFGISPKANIYKNKDIVNADLADPAQAEKVKGALEDYLKKYPKANPEIRGKVISYLLRQEFHPAPKAPTEITEASITPQADQAAVQQRLLEGFKNRPEIKKIYEDYNKKMQEGDADKAALSAFNSIVTPQTIKSFGIPSNSSIYNDQDLVNADLSNPETADQIRVKLEAIRNATKSPKIKENIDKYLNRNEFITPSFVDQYLNPPREAGEENLDHFVFTNNEGELESKYGTIVEKNGKKYAKYSDNKLQKGGERELNENVLVNPKSPEQMELMTLYKARDKLMKEPDDFKQWLVGKGVDPKERADIAIENRLPHKMFREGGYPLDDLVRMAVEEGILHEPDFQEGVGGVESMRNYIKMAVDGQFVPTSNNMRNMNDLENLQQHIENLENQVKGTPEEIVAEQATEEKPEIPEASKNTMEAKATMKVKKPTPHQVEIAERVANARNGDVVYQDGDIVLVRTYNTNGDAIYLPAKNGTVAFVDVDRFTGNWISDADKKALKDVKRKLEDARAKQTNNIVQFNNDGLSFSKDIDVNLAGVITGWKKLFGLNQRIYVSTIEDAIANKDKFTGPYTRIAGEALRSRTDNGLTANLANGDRFILIRPSTNKTLMLETIAHEMGHAHEKEVYKNASPELKKQIDAEYQKWLSSQKGKTAKELLHSLRAKKTAETTKSSDSIKAEDLDNFNEYWSSFAEWYADQVSRWATTSEKPLSVVDKFFAKIANGLRKIFSMLKNKGYLPNETFKKYMDGITNSPSVKVDSFKPISVEDQQTLFSKSTMKASFEGVDQAYANAIKKQFTREEVTVQQKFKSLKTNFFDKMVTGLFDEFRAIKNYTTEGYMMARLSKSIDGGLQGLLEHGQVYLKDGALDIRPGTKGLMEILEPLGKEVDQYQIWKALNRDAQMPADKRSFPDELVAGRNKLTNGNLNGKPRIEVYKKALSEENQLNKSVLDIALETGLIDRQAYQTFSNDIYYIPFYKYMDENGGDVQAVSASSKLTGQYFSKSLKGGEKKTNDLMENVLLNWSHILSASMKNQAALKTVQAAESMGAATKAKPMDGKYPPGSIKLMEEGKTTHYTLEDPDLVDAISTISYLGPKSAFLDVAKGFTNALRYGITLSPAYKVRNLIRDSLQSASVSELGPNMFENVYNGLRMTKKGDPTFMSALAGGGIFEMGTAHEGDQAKLIKRLIDKGVKEGSILDTPEKIKNQLQNLLNQYNELGNKFENANRLALYKKLLDSGKSHLEASYAARDLMDFSMQGQFRAVKVIGSVVPFFNARLQGLYKLGRDGISPTYRVISNATTGAELKIGDKEKAQRFMVMSSAIALASIALYGMYKDDEDFQRREDWDRDNFWWFKIGDTQFRIPKPFEIGAFGTIAERTYEQLVDENVEGKVFGQRLNAILMDTFSLNPTPQMIKPLIDIYANKDSFTGAPIESAGMERLSKQERLTDRTSGVAIALGGISEGAAKILTFNPNAQGISPVQMDYFIKAYLGWMGATAVATADRAVEPFQEGTKVHPPIIDTLAMGFIKTEPQTQSKYMTQFYENNARLQSALADMRHFAEIGDTDKLTKVLEEKGDDIALAKVYDKATKQLADLRKMNRQIESNKEISADDKRAEMNRIRILMSDISKQMEQIRKSR